MPELDSSKIAGFIAREALGIRDDTRPVAESQTPVGQLSDDMFERRDKMARLVGRKQEVQGLDPEVLEMAKLAVRAYTQIHESSRRSAVEDRYLLADQYEHYGEHTTVVGKVKVSPAGPEGRWMVTFTTTHVQDANDWAANASTMLFDVQSERLDESYPAREDHWIVGEKNGKREVLGNYKRLHQYADGKLTESLQNQGWKNIGEIWAADVDRHAGFLTPPASS